MSVIKNDFYPLKLLWNSVSVYQCKIIQSCFCQSATLQYMFICKVVQAYQNLQGVFWHQGALYTLATYLCGWIVPIKVCRAVELVSLVQTDFFLYWFAKDKLRRQRWMAVLRRSDFQPSFLKLSLQVRRFWQEWTHNLFKCSNPASFFYIFWPSV